MAGLVAILAGFDAGVVFGSNIILSSVAMVVLWIVASVMKEPEKIVEPKPMKEPKPPEKPEPQKNMEPTVKPSPNESKLPKDQEPAKESKPKNPEPQKSLEPQKERKEDPKEKYLTEAKKSNASENKTTKASLSGASRAETRIDDSLTEKCNAPKGLKETRVKKLDNKGLFIYELGKGPRISPESGDPDSKI
jgi:outer membrane biosynthesis protein TonB